MRLPAPRGSLPTGAAPGTLSPQPAGELLLWGGPLSHPRSAPGSEVASGTAPAARRGRPPASPATGHRLQHTARGKLGTSPGPAGGSGLFSVTVTLWLLSASSVLRLARPGWLERKIFHFLRARLCLFIVLPGAAWGITAHTAVLDRQLCSPQAAGSSARGWEAALGEGRFGSRGQRLAV